LVLCLKKFIPNNPPIVPPTPANKSKLNSEIRFLLFLAKKIALFPFISRYRKDQTGNLDEVQIEQIFKLNKQFEEIVKRKESILKAIEEQGQFLRN
jgi:transcriptional accessory protein Tex/SPT6